MKQLKFDEAIAFYQQKLSLPTEVWEQIIEESQDWAFTIAGVEKANVLQSVYDLILKVLQGRSNTVTTFEQFSDRFNEIMEAGGYGEQKHWRSKLVYKQNIKTAYNAGRYRSQTDSEAIKRRPYLQYIHGHPIDPRPHHKALHLKIWRADDPIWNFIYPQNGFNCSCQVVSLSERDMKREGLKVSPPIADRVTLRDRLTGRTKSVPAIRIRSSEFGIRNYPPPGSIISGDEILVPVAEPGFNYAPGKSQPEQRKEILDSAIARLATPIRQQVLQNLLANR